MSASMHARAQRRADLAAGGELFDGDLVGDRLSEVSFGFGLSAGASMSVCSDGSFQPNTDDAGSAGSDAREAPLEV